MKREHEWIRRARVFLMDNYHPPFWPDITFDAGQVVKAMQYYHANAIRIGSAGKWAVFPNDHWPPHPGLNGRDMIQEMIEEAHPQGIRVITYVPLSHIIPDDNIMVNHPEWLHHPARGVPATGRFHHGGGLHRHVCWNTPYRNAITRFVKQLVTDHEIDCFYTDSTVPYHSHPGPRSNLCYCNCCQEKFEDRFGCPIPYAPDPHSLSKTDQEILEQWSLEYGRIVSDVLIELVEWIRKERDIPVVTHGCGFAFWPEARLMEVHDGLLYEAGGDFLHRLEATSLGESSGKAVWQYVGALTGWSRLQCFSQDLVEEAAASFAGGGAVLVACGVNLTLAYPQSTHEELASFFSILESNIALMDNLHPTCGVAVPYVLPVRAYEMLDHLRFRTKPLKISDRPGDAVKGAVVDTPSQETCIRGAFSSMLANHLPVQMVEEGVLRDSQALSRYPLLFLPNIGHLKEDEVQTVSDYVAAGGCLLASYRTSLYGPGAGELLDNFALADLLGVDRIDCDPDRRLDYEHHLWHSGVFDVYLRSVKDEWLARSHNQEIWPANRFEMVRERPGTKVVANIVWGGREEELLWPAVTSREIGKGRVVYLAPALEQLHFEYRMPMIRDLLGAIVDWLCPKARPVTMQAPDQLLAIPNEKPGTQVLFLINHTGERVEGLSNMWPRLSRQFEYVPPVAEVTLRWRLNTTAGPERVWDVVTGDDLEFSWVKGRLSIELEDVGQYAILAAEL